MKRLAIFLVLLLSSAAFSADAGRMSLNLSMPISAQGTIAPGNFVINSAGGTIDRVGWVVQLPVADTWTHIGFRYGARVGTPVQHRIGIQGITTGGLPDGTFAGGGSPNSATFTPPADATWDGTWQWIDLDNDFVGTRGQLVSVVIEPVGTPDGSNNSSFTQGLTNAFAGRHGFPYNLTQTDGGAFTRVPARVPVVALKSATRVVGFPHETLFTTSIATNGHRQALRINLNSGFGDTYKIIGIRFLSATPLVGNNFKIGLWEGTTEHQATTIDSDFVATAGNNHTSFEYYFDDTPVALSFGTEYFLGLERVDAACGINGLQVDTSGDLKALNGGDGFYLGTFNGTSWSTDQTVRPLVEPIFEEWTEPAAGGGVIGGPNKNGNKQ
jgi:hypothetical protein